MRNRSTRDQAAVTPRLSILSATIDRNARSLVSEVAAFWGFGSTWKFAAAYRRHFGEQPSETLRRLLEHPRSEIQSAFNKPRNK